MNQLIYHNIVQKKPYLFWSVGDKSKLSEQAVVEAVLGFGDMEDFAVLQEHMGLNRVAGIFSLLSKMPRTSLNEKTRNFWKIYFERHASPGFK